MVAVNADASVKRRGKGDERPVDGLEDCTVLARIYEAFPLPDLPCLDAHHRLYQRDRYSPGWREMMLGSFWYRSMSLGIACFG